MNPPAENLRRWLLALVCYATLIFFFSPTWGAFRLWGRAPEMGGMLEVRRGVSVLQQMQNPGAEIADKLHAAIQWRLLFPVIGHVLHLPPVIFFSLAHVGCVLALAFVIAVLRRRGASFGFAAGAALVLGAGSWYFASVCWLGYFDAWVVLALLLVAFAESAWPMWAACVWAPWIDERFVLGLPLALLCRWLQRAATGKSFAWKQELAWPAGLALAFVVVRLGWLSGKTAAGATIGGYFAGLENGGAGVARMALGVWEGLRVGWIFVAAACWWLARERAVLLGVVVVLLVGCGLATAQDFSRSMMFVAPAALLGAVLAVEKISALPRWLPATTVIAALVLPAHHVMSNQVNPIFYFYHELAMIDRPPPAAMPELIELRAVNAMERGEYAQAAQDLTLAIRLSENPSGPARHRGLLAASLGKWDEAKQDFTLVVEHDPESPEGWFLRAQAELALGDRAGAASDVEQARARGPSDWANRPDVARFLARLNQAK